jgi:hypothetical protein
MMSDDAVADQIFANGPLRRRGAPEPRHGIAELLRLVGAVRRLAFDRTLPPPEALGRIRDAYREYDGGVVGN